MFKKFIVVVMLIFLLSLTAVSAADDSNESISTDSNNEVLKSIQYNITNDNYKEYFNNNTGDLTYKINEGDTILLNDDFNDTKFNFKKSINVIGAENTKLENCMLTFSNDASNSTISSLNIHNTNYQTYGIFLNGVSNCTISNCFINNTGASSYTVCIANGAQYNNVVNNSLHAYGISYGHGTRSTPPIVLSGAHYNYIANNNISCDDANGIYLSSYPGGPLNGGRSNYNKIYNNTIKYNVLPTSWAYAIQLMGLYNIVDSNTIIGAYMGIVGSHNTTITNNRLINITGADYNHPNDETGGQAAITAGSNSIIINNTIINAKIFSTGSAVSVSDDCVIENNYIETSLAGVGIHPQGSNILIKNNTIITNSGSVILFNTFAFDLKIISNNITSQSGVGILISKVSDKRMPGNITITYNNILTNNEYAIDAKEADASMYWEEHDNNIGNSKKVTPEGEYDPSSVNYVFKGKTYIITPDNYSQYINDNGGLSSIIENGDILFFSGEFSNKVIFINKAIKITGKNPKFYNTTFRVSSAGTWIENLTIVNIESERINAWGVLVYKVSGATISNCKIDVYDPNAAYAIYVVESSNIDVIGNTLSSRGNYLTYTLLAHTVEECKFINNTIFTNGTGTVHKFENEHCLEGDSVCTDGNSLCLDGNSVCLDGSSVCLDGNSVCLDGSSVCTDGDSVCPDGAEYIGNHVLTEVYRTYGILMVYSSNNIVSNNKVTVTSQLNQTYSSFNSTNSLVGIDLYFNSHNNTFSDNNVNVRGLDNNIYGMGVLGYNTGHPAPEGQGASDNRFINNQINIEGDYVVEGIIIGNEASNTTIINNTVILKSAKTIYGINLEMSQNSIILNNNLILNADIIYGLEAMDSNYNVIVKNQFSANAKQVHGMALSNSNYNNISSNIIFSNATGEEIDYINHDSIEYGNSGIYLKSNSSNNIIVDNNITSTKDYAIKVDIIATNNLISDNYLVCENYIGNNAVNNTNSSNTVEYNYKYVAVGKLNESESKYLHPINLIFASDDSTLDGAIVKFYDFENNEINSSVLNNGVAGYNLTSTSEFTPGSYLISAKVFKENYKVTEFTSILFVDYGDLNVAVDEITGVIRRNANFTANVKNILGEGVSGIFAEFYLVDEGYPNYIGSATSDENGFICLNAEVPMVYGENPQIKVEINNPTLYNSVDAYANITTIVLNDTVLEVNSNLYPGNVLAILKDKNGNALVNKSISIIIGSKTFKTTTSDDGAVLMPSISRGTYSATVLFEGDNDYYSAKVSKNIKILPSISENSNYNLYYGNTVQYKVRITGSDGKYVGAGHLVTVKVNGLTYNIKTDSKGYASKSIKLNVGTYTITAQYNGDSVVNKIVIKPVLITNNVVKKKSKKIKFTAKLVDKKGKILKNKKITFKIKGKKYTAKTNKKGVATVNILNLKVGTFTIVSSYGGCSVKNTIKVKK